MISKKPSSLSSRSSYKNNPTKRRIIPIDTKIKIAMDIAANVPYTDVLKKYVISKGTYDHVKRNLNSFISKNIISHDTSLKHSFDLDDVIFKTFMNLRSKNIPINGNILKQICLRISEDIGLNNF
ncbi:hypothetical protein DMUE_0140 [Dictyocoela muelleri]|nr:hypothetical protein DMUE_0140 [Dictyocoela muelleri]